LLYEERCVQCHGSNGNGNGNLSEHLQPRPRNFQSKDWQRQVSDIEIKRVIIGGGGAVQKSVLMPANPDLRGKPKLIEALIYLIRTFDLSNQLDESQLPLNQGPTE
jgi:cytochrome c oxidase cbb3-type subunit 3